MAIAGGMQEKLDEMLKRNMRRVTRKVMVLSNKGGVGKSSFAASLAIALNRMGNEVGILDADIHGPSMVKMMGQEGRNLPKTDGGLAPLEVMSGLKLVSMAALSGSEDSPTIWRGPMKSHVLKQFLAEIEWGRLDYLIIDSPPGTGDEPLSICQMLPDLAGGIIITTPQEIALLDARKCVAFLKQLHIPVLGLVENMSSVECPHCGKPMDLFGAGGGAKASEELGVELLGRIPFDSEMVKSTDHGHPFIELHKGSKAADALIRSVRVIVRRVSAFQSRGKGAARCEATAGIWGGGGAQ